MVGVIHNGKIIQEGTVDEVFQNPSNRFVARYAGIRNFFKVNISGEDGLLTAVTEQNVRFKLNGAKLVSDSLLLVKSDLIVLTNEIPEDKELNTIKGKITEIIPIESGMEVTIDAGDLFYVNIPASDLGELKLFVEKEVWMSFTTKDIFVISGN